MKILAPLIVVVSLSATVPFDGVWAQAPGIDSVRFTDAALAFSSGSIQKTTPIDGIVNLITGDNQSTGNRMLLGKRDVLYLKLSNPHEVAVGDLYTVYRRVRKVFHPVTKEYLGFIVNRSGIVKVTAADHALTTVEVVITYGPISPGDPVTRFVTPSIEETANLVSAVSDLDGMIVELQANQAMTLVSQSNVVYLDRGSEDGLKVGDLVDIYRHSAGLPPRTIGQLKVLWTEPRSATAKVMKANTRVIRGDRFKLTGHSTPAVQPLGPSSEPLATPGTPAVSANAVASKLTTRDALGQSRLNLGELANFLHYDSGEAAIKSDNYKILDQLIEHLHVSNDMRRIRVEGHTDNVEIGPSLKSRYPNNLELSKARANGVVRYLVEKGGLDPSRLSAVGYGDTKPTAANTAEEGRTKNRRVEILLYAPDTDTTAAQPDVQNQDPKPATAISRTSARGNTDQSTAATTGTDSPDSPSQGTLSVGNASQTPDKDGGGGTYTSDPNGSATPDAGKQSTSSQQPTSGMTSE